MHVRPKNKNWMKHKERTVSQWFSFCFNDVAALNETHQIHDIKRDQGHENQKYAINLYGE